MKIVTWNVNGLSSVVNYPPWNDSPTPFKVDTVTFDSLIITQTLLEQFSADIICFQEHKLQQRDITASMANVPGFDGYFTFSQSRKGYSGVYIPSSTLVDTVGWRLPTKRDKMPQG
jgi:AP endonuclease 2